jgi:threonine/homoserine/homoserine lactone efflux protein
MASSILITGFLAAMAYVLIPGPATLVALHYSATRGRIASAQFLAAHLLGDIFWSVLALLAIVGVTSFGPDLFDLLGIACGIYLVWLGMKAVTSRGSTATPIVASPVRTGLVFGFTNPKAYPFALAMFTAVFGGTGAAVTLADTPVLFGVILAGFVTADLAVVAWTGLHVVTRLFLRHAVALTRGIGMIFLLFGAKSIWDGTTNLRSRA